MGTPDHPTHAWKLQALQQALVALQVSTPRNVIAKTPAQLLARVAAAYTDGLPQILQAFQCMQSIRAQIQKGQFGLWGQDPQ